MHKLLSPTAHRVGVARRYISLAGQPTVQCDHRDVGNVDPTLRTNTDNAHFHAHSLAKLVNGYLTLRLGGLKTLSNNAQEIYDRSVKVLGAQAINNLIRHTFFAHFVAGENETDLVSECERMLRQNVKLMLCPPMEDIEGEMYVLRVCDAYFSPQTASLIHDHLRQYEHYLSVANRVRTLQQAGGQDGCIQYKATSMFPAKLMTRMSQYYEKNDIPLIDTVQQFAEWMAVAEEPVYDPNDDFQVIKVALWNTDRYLAKCAATDSLVMIDAELHSMHYMEQAITLAAAMRHNRVQNRAIIYGTFQHCFKDMPHKLGNCLDIARKLGIRFAAKCVRGAYVETERRLAMKNGYADPTHANHKATSDCYDADIELMLREVANDPENCSVFIASNNIASAGKAVQLMTQLSIPSNSPNVNFGQVFGFVDGMSAELGHRGYNVYKSTPYGPLAEWVPYLTRRAAESRSALLTARSELPDYAREIRRRCMIGRW